MAQTTRAATLLQIGEDEPFQIPVAVKKIRQQSDVSLDTASPDHNPIRQLYVDLETGEEVPRSEIRKGIFRSKPSRDKETWSDFAAIPGEDLDVIEEATKIETFQIKEFIPLADVPRERITDAYFLAPPEGMSAKPLVLLARALKRTKRAGVFKFVKTSRQHLAVVYEQDGGLIVNTLAWSGDFAAVREAAQALDRADAKVSSAEVSLAADLVTTLAADASVLDSYEDDLIPLKQDLVDRALRGERLPKRQQREQVVPEPDDSLEARLRESLERVGVPA